jgi:hypothetical protein
MKNPIYAASTFLVGLFLLLQPAVAKDGDDCVDCHKLENQGLYEEWSKSEHGKHNVNCLDCHKAESTDKDAFTHFGGYTISVIVTPNDCAKCHEKEAKEFKRSHHSKGGDILASLDNVLGATLGGPAAVTVGCEQCHGSKVEFDADGKPTQGWPNTGIGRINPDGSLGSCTACHARHGFSVAQARTPQTCGKCHLGPDHPQIEVYDESKHGIIYYAKVDEMNLDSEEWVVGVDYSVAPTCTTCHMGATPDEEKTHDVGERLSWDLRSKISIKKNMVRLDNDVEYDVPEGQALPNIGDKPDDPKAQGGTVIEVLTWEDRRAKMRKVCRACHSPNYVAGHYRNLDDLVLLYNDKFAKPISAIMGELTGNGIISKTAFDDAIEWTWWEIWHHEGRRARTGAAMSGPDYAWWHGIYDVAKHTYMKFIPELFDVAGENEGWRLLNQYFKPIEGHEWYFEAVAFRPSLEEIVAINMQTGNEVARGNYAGFEPSVTHNSPGLEIKGTLTVSDSDIPGVGKLIGQKVKMMAVVVSSDNHLYLVSNTNGQLVPWNGDVNSLTSLKEITLASTQEFEILNGEMTVNGNPLMGAVSIYLGFRIDNILLFFPETIDS